MSTHGPLDPPDPNGFWRGSRDTLGMSLRGKFVARCVV